MIVIEKTLDRLTKLGISGIGVDLSRLRFLRDSQLILKDAQSICE